MLIVHRFACLTDNYGFLARDEATGKVACIDTPDAAAILGKLERLGWRLDLILNTHWHADHAGGTDPVLDQEGLAELLAQQRGDRPGPDRSCRCPAADPGSRICRPGMHPPPE